MGYGGLEINDLGYQVHRWAVKQGFWDEKLGDSRAQRDIAIIAGVIDGMEKRRKADAGKEQLEVGPDDQVATKLELIISEVIEAWDTYMHKRDEGRTPEEALKAVWKNEKGQEEGVGPELAGTVIRIVDCAEGWGFNLESRIIHQRDYNETRPRRNGKNF